MESIKTIEQVAQILADFFGNDAKILKKEYEEVMKKPESVKNKIFDLLTGVDTSHSEEMREWNTFKRKLIDRQKEIGFVWVPVKGQFGPIELQTIELKREVGREICHKLLKDKTINNGDFDNIYKEYLPNLTAFAQSIGFDKKKFIIKEAKEGFSEPSDNGVKFKYITNGTKFNKVKETYTFRGGERKSEKELGDLIEELLRSRLNLHGLVHIQESRGGNGTYTNPDFFGYKIKTSKISDDVLEAISIELKPSNAIDKVSDAISQAINYKVYANKTYIAIPLFSEDNFHDKLRFRSLYSLCVGNGIGIISIDIDLETHSILDLTIELEPLYNEIQDFKFLDNVMKSNEGKNYPIVRCPLCHKFVSDDKERNFCGWSYNNKCMKVHLEENMGNT